MQKCLPELKKIYVYKYSVHVACNQVGKVHVPDSSEAVTRWTSGELFSKQAGEPNI